MNLFGVAVIFWLNSALEEIVGETKVLLSKPSAQSSWIWSDFGNKKSDNLITGWSHPEPGKQQYSVCDVSAKIKAINWLRTDFINVKDAKLLEIKVWYSLRCPVDKCVTSFGLFAYHADAKDPAPDPTTDEFKKVADMQSTSTPGTVSVNYVSSATVVTKKAGVYLAFLDNGACFFITKVTVSYKYCPPTGGVLVKFQETVAPANNSQLVKQYGECTDFNSVNQTELSAVCLSSGEWYASGDISCLCRAGYELVSGSGDTYNCEECPADLYKDVVNNSKCQPCPANSSPNPDRKTCKCDAQFYREDLAAIKECEALPAAPQKSNKTALVEGTSVTIWWSKSPSGQGKITYSLDCFKCRSKKDKNCEDSCSERISYRPRKVNITGIEATVIGLAPYSYFMFRVYAVNELNHLEKDRDKWNYVQVFVATGEERDQPTGSGTGGTGMSKTLRMALYIAVPIGVVLIFLIIIFGIFFCRGRSKRGYGQPVEMKDGSVVLPTTGQRLYIDPSNYEDPEEALRNFAKELDKIQIKLEKVIGGGEFGEVYKGELTRPDEEPIAVAIKTLKATSIKKDRDDFLAEASIMGQFCDPNVIYLEGVITKTLPLMIVTEFMANGSLDHFLKDMDGKLSVLQLLGMARGVASGMKYLSDMNFVHRDLAARNVLVSEGMVCKVADFGLSREVEDSAYETKGGKIPVRWTSPEAIDFRKFSWASDVWSYGILLWEIMSFGERPYWQWTNFKVIERVKGGYRLPPPVGNQEKCPKSIHNIMLNCWDADRNKRPTFAAIVKRLDYLIRSPDRLNEDPATTNSCAKLECTKITSVKDWLESIKMGIYSDRFQKCGYQQLGDLAKQDDLDLNEIGVKLIGHKNKIRKSFREMKKALQEEPSVTSLPV